MSRINNQMVNQSKHLESINIVKESINQSNRWTITQMTVILLDNLKSIVKIVEGGKNYYSIKNPRLEKRKSNK